VLEKAQSVAAQLQLPPKQAVFKNGGSLFLDIAC
jgi:hypothetical protein